MCVGGRRSCKATKSNNSKRPLSEKGAVYSTPVTFSYQELARLTTVELNMVHHSSFSEIHFVPHLPPPLGNSSSICVSSQKRWSQDAPAPRYSLDGTKAAEDPYSLIGETFFSKPLLLFLAAFAKLMLVYHKPCETTQEESIS